MMAIWKYVVFAIANFEYTSSKWYRATNLDNKISQNRHGLTSRNLIRCANACAANATCQSFFFLEGKQENCILQSTILFPGLPCLVEEQGSVYYIKENSCPHGWLSHLESCYYFDDRIVTFQQAQEVCTLLGGYMVHVETAEENEFLTNYLRTHLTNESSANFYSRVSVWLGMTFTPDQTWTWLDDGSVAAFTSWYSGEPNGGVGEPCAVLHGNFAKYLWADVRCTRAFRTFCERR